MPHALPRSWITLLLLAGAMAVASAAAQHAASPRTLEEIHGLALASSVDVASRTNDVAAAERDRERAGRDPLATALERLQAQHAVAAAREALEAARASNRLTTLQRVVAVLEAVDAQATAVGAGEVAERQLAADRVRAEAGMITSVDLDRSNAAADAARRSVSDALAAVSLARSELGLMVGLAADDLASAGLEPLSVDLPTLPPLDDVLAESRTTHAGMASAIRALEVVEVRLAGSDHEGTAPNALATLRTDRDASRRRVDDVAASASLQIRSTYQAVAQAYARYRSVLADEATADTTLAAMRVRAAAGEVSPLAMRQAELDRARASVTTRTALHAAWVAWYRLQQARIGG
jgi:outer membrane protein TolC